MPSDVILQRFRDKLFYCKKISLNKHFLGALCLIIIPEIFGAIAATLGAFV
jgi:hypothetical protein